MAKQLKDFDSVNLGEAVDSFENALHNGAFSSSTDCFDIATSSGSCCLGWSDCLYS